MLELPESLERERDTETQREQPKHGFQANLKRNEANISHELEASLNISWRNPHICATSKLRLLIISEHLSIGNLKLCSGAQDKRDLHSNMHMYIYIYMIYTHSQEI